LLQVVVKFLAEGDGVKFFLHCSMQPFTDTIALGMTDLRLGVFAFNLQIPSVMKMVI